MNDLGLSWMLILKDNQPGMYAAADAWNWEDEPVLHGTSETGHGRHEIRTIRVTSCIPDLIRQKLPGAEQMLLIERYRHDLPRGTDTTACRAGDHDPLACGAGLASETVLAVPPTPTEPRANHPATKSARQRRKYR